MSILPRTRKSFSAHECGPRLRYRRKRGQEKASDIEQRRNNRHFEGVLQHGEPGEIAYGAFTRARRCSSCGVRAGRALCHDEEKTASHGFAAPQIVAQVRTASVHQWNGFGTMTFFGEATAGCRVFKAFQQGLATLVWVICLSPDPVATGRFAETE